MEEKIKYLIAENTLQTSAHAESIRNNQLQLGQAQERIREKESQLKQLTLREELTREEADKFQTLYRRELSKIEELEKSIRSNGYECDLKNSGSIQVPIGKSKQKIILKI